MKNRNTWKKIAVLCLSVAFTLGAASCGEGLVTTDSNLDMSQVVATVNIADHDDFKSGGKYSAYADAIGTLNQNILKRDLIAYFLNVGYTYVNSYGYTYKQTFTTLMDNLISRKIMVQYAMVYYFDTQSDVYTVAGLDSYVESEKAAIADETVKALYEAHPEILTLKYFLTEGGKADAESTADYDRAVYSLKSMINNTLDSAEADYIKNAEEADTTTFGDSRTTPTGVGTETEDYYDTDYDVYTGFNAPSSCGSYERPDGSTQTSRRMAYNVFLANLANNNLLSEDEDTKEIGKIDYYYVELASQLEQAIITKYSDDLSKEANAELNEGYVSERYNSIKTAQQNSYTSDQSAFETAIGSLSDDSFVLYSPKEGFGFVYNILLKFSPSQQQILSTYTNDAGLKKQEYYAARAKLLQAVKGKDLRAAWFSNNDDSNYAYRAEAGSYYGAASDYLFFEDNLTKSEGDNAQYESLGQYEGKYAYNGVVTMDEDDDTKFASFKPNELNIDQFLTEMESYLNWNDSGLNAHGGILSTYVTDADGYTMTKGEFDYSQFLYYEGNVTLDDFSNDSYFVKGTKAYTAVSRINELMFAYSEDTGCLNTYMGYTVSPYKTSYVAEFEYAAQYAIRQGVGTYVVCPSDYGWHVIYVSFVYDEAGDVYDGFDWNRREEEGTFSYLFYEATKKESEDTYTNKIQNRILDEYNKDACVTRFVKRYQDLLNLDNN